jgi:hypothetical protein
MGVEFSNLGELESIFLTWRAVYKSVLGLDSLVRVNILDYPSNDLTTWKQSKRLNELLLSSKRLETLSGIDRFPHLSRLRLFRCSKLRSLGAITASISIQKLRIDRCPNILDLSPISYLSELKELEIEDCADIASVAPIAECRNLELLQIAGNTTVLDGDFSNLCKLPKLKRVLIARRKHYTHLPDDL